MSLLDRLKHAAVEAKDRLSAEAERATGYLAKHGPGAVGATAAEFLAEQQYRKALALAGESPGRDTAPQVIEILLPHWNVPGNYAVLINRLLARAYQATGDLAAAREHFRTALTLLDDPSWAISARTVIVEETEQVPSDMATDLVVELASLELAAGEYRTCVRQAMEALSRDARTLTAYYLQGVAMLRLGLPADEVSALFVKAMHHGDPATVVDWVRELMPDRVAWFERMAG